MAATAAKSKAKADEIVNRRRMVSQLRLAGATTREIAAQVHASQTAVVADLHVVLAEWQAERVENVDQLVTRELLKLNEIEIEAITIWREEQVRAKKFHPIIDITTKAVTGYEGRPPNPTYLDRIITIRESRRRLLGLDGPTKIDHTFDIERVKKRAAELSAASGVPIEEIIEIAMTTMGVN